MTISCVASRRRRHLAACVTSAPGGEIRSRPLVWSISAAMLLFAPWVSLSSWAQDAQPGEPHHLSSVSLDEALALSQVRASSLQVRDASLAVARAQRPAAGQLPDPRLSLGVENLPVNGPDAYSLTRDFMTMRRVAWMQEMPNAAKRDAQQYQAQALVEREEALLRAEQVSVRRETALAWLALFYAQRRLDAFSAVDQQNQLVQETIAARVSAGQALPSEALMARQDALSLADRRDEIERDASRARANLQRWIGPVADVATTGNLPAWLQDPLPSPQVAQQAHQQLNRHAALLAYEPMKRMAQADVQEAKAQRRGDWGWELAYSKRGPGYGDMVSFQVSFDLPLWQGDRQLPRLQARERELDRLEAEQADTSLVLAAQVESQLAEFAAISRTLERLQANGLPLAQQRASLSLASYQGGRGDLASVLAARRDLAEQRLRLIDLQAQRDALLAGLHYMAAVDEPSNAQAAQLPQGNGSQAQ